eukprot:4220386-Prorocentrum_lima.AAC.1
MGAAARCGAASNWPMRPASHRPMGVAVSSGGAPLSAIGVAVRSGGPVGVVVVLSESHACTGA